MRAISEGESWLYKNPDALASVRRGLKDAAEGRVVDMKEHFYKSKKKIRASIIDVCSSKVSKFQKTNVEILGFHNNIS